MESSSSRSVSRRTKADTRVIACVRARVQASLSMRRFARERERTSSVFGVWWYIRCARELVVRRGKILYS